MDREYLSLLQANGMTHEELIEILSILITGHSITTSAFRILTGAVTILNTGEDDETNA